MTDSIKDSPLSDRQHVNCDEGESLICQNCAVIYTAVVHMSQAHSVDWLERLVSENDLLIMCAVGR